MIGLALAFANAPLAPVPTYVIAATPEAIVRKLDGRSQEVYGTGLGGLVFSSARSGRDKARVTIRHIASGEEIVCSMQAASQPSRSGRESRIVSTCDRAQFPRQSRHDDTMSVAKPMVLEYVKSAVNGGEYDTMAVANEILRRQGVANPALIFEEAD